MSWLDKITGLDKNRVGYVYIFNRAGEDFLKIGKTQTNPRERARQLSNETGVSTQFQVVHSVYVKDMHKVETLTHKALRKHRVNPNREFFDLSPKKAISQLDEIAEDYLLNTEEKREVESLADDEDYFFRIKFGKKNTEKLDKFLGVFFKIGKSSTIIISIGMIIFSLSVLSNFGYSNFQYLGAFILLILGVISFVFSLFVNKK